MCNPHVWMNLGPNPEIGTLSEATSCITHARCKHGNQQNSNVLEFFPWRTAMVVVISLMNALQLF